MNFDLILTARDRRTETLRFFSSLANQQGEDRIRVLFADQGLKIHSEAVNLVSRRQSTSLETVEISPMPLSMARNSAISLGLRSDIVGFPDDDCWYGPSVLASIRNVFNEHPEIDCLCTNVFDPDRNISYGGRPVGPRIFVTYANIFALPISVGIFVRRQAFEVAGSWFRDFLGAGTTLGSGEETELISRLLSSGANILYTGDISVYHPVPIYNPSDANKYYSYGLGYGYLSAKFILKGKHVVLLDFLNVMIRSIAGIGVFTFNSSKRLVYWSRLKGVLKGSYLALSSRD